MVEIRKLNLKDWEIFRAIRLKAVAETPQYFLYNFEDESARPDTYWQGMLSDKRHAIFILQDKEDVIGLTAIFTWHEDPSEKTAVLAMSYIDPAYRGKGYADLLYTARIEWAKAQPHLERIVVSHREGNEASRRSNQRFGFIFTNVNENTYGDGTTDKNINYELSIK
jgi:RimJ/RimL family protein N-acetyltransferase